MNETDIDLLAIVNRAIRDPVWDARSYSFPKQVETIWPTEASIIFHENGVRIVEGACNRATWYRLKHYKPLGETEDRMHWIWRFGKLLEDDVNLLLKQTGFLAARNVRFHDNTTSLPISGEMDAIGVMQDHRGEPINFVIDVKTTGGNYQGTTKILGNTKTRPFPKVPNLLQIMIYLNVDPQLKFGKLMYLIRDNLVGNEFTIRLKDHNGLKIANIKSTVWNSSTSIVGAFGQDYPQYSVEGIYARFQELSNYYLKNILPPPDYSIEYSEQRAEDLYRIDRLSDNQITEHRKGKLKGDYQCIGCKYVEYCKNNR